MIDREELARWLPSESFRDDETHFVLRQGEAAICGEYVMWARPGHPTTTRPHCAECEAIIARSALIEFRHMPCR